MGEWSVAALGYSILLALVVASYALPRYLPDSEWTQMYLRPRFARRSGPYLTESRRDRFRRGIQTLGVSVIVCGGGVGSGVLAERAAPNSALQFTLLAYMFIGVILGVTLAVAALGSLLLTPFLPARTVRGEVAALAPPLAAFLEEYAASGRDAGEWPDFSAVRYEAPLLEEVRSELAAAYACSRPPVPELHAAHLRALADRLRPATT